MALESVNFNESRAEQILKIMMEEEQQKNEIIEIEHTE